MSRIQLLKELLSTRIAVLDGGMGTMLQRQNLTAADFGGAEYEGCNEHLLLTKPEAIASVHRAYYAAGADIVETCTFGSTPLVMDEYKLGPKAFDISVAGAKIARAEAEAAQAKDGKPRFVAGSMGPTTKSLSLTGGATFLELVDSFRVQAGGLWDGGSDFLLLETQLDTLNTKAGLVGIEQAARERGIKIPVAISGTVEMQGFLLAGQSAEAFYASLEHVDPLYVGLNCATGPEFMTDHIRSLARSALTNVACAPNAGLPNEYGGLNGIKYRDRSSFSFDIFTEGFGVPELFTSIGYSTGKIKDGTPLDYNGLTATIGYKITPALQVIGRFDTYNQKNDTPNAIESKINGLTFGTNYLFFKEKTEIFKLGLNYQVRNEDPIKIDNNTLLLWMQVKF